MRWTLLLLVACSSSSTATSTPPKDAGTTPDEDAGTVVVDDAGVPLACTEAKSCIAYGTTCEGGFKYGCFGGRCPTSAGACTVLSVDGIENYSEACCAELACVRQAAPGDAECKETFDGGLPTAWTCPNAKKPEGTCSPRFAGSFDFCCK